jgi:hypothetical protein
MESLWTFYDLLMCAVNPSVCLQWGGGGWEEREDKGEGEVFCLMCPWGEVGREGERKIHHDV